MLETGTMPPLEATEQPTDAERASAARWVRTSLKAYETAHAGDPGRVTVRRLTSGEYAYAVRDLTGIDITVGIDTSSDSVGGEGFTNFGDVQFVQDASVERYLEAAKLVADHAVIGAGPLEFYPDAGRTGLELSALNRINELYATKGFRVVSGEGGRPFGLERYGKAFYVAWYYKHRVALGDPTATIRGLAAKEGITGRFADHIWTVVNKPNTGYPTRETVDRWTKLPAPTADIKASLANGRAGSDDIYKSLTTWPSWFFARGDLAAGGAGDESPLSFDDTTLKAAPTHRYTYALGVRGGRGRGAAPTPGPSPVYLTLTNVNPIAGVTPVVIWRNPRVITRAAPAGRGAPGAGAAPAASACCWRATWERRSDSLDAVPEIAAAGRRRGHARVRHAAQTARRSGRTISRRLAASRSRSTCLPAATPWSFKPTPSSDKDRNAVVRVMISDRPEGTARDAIQRVLIGDPQSAGYKTFRADIAEYVALLPPNSHGEANPADKDPVPAPFDNTYNSPEHDAFVLKVKYQRSDTFFTDNMVDGADRARLNQAWNDLFGSWPYHDAYLGMLIDHYALSLKSRRIQDLDAAQIAALPAEVRPYLDLAARALRRGDEGADAGAAGPRRGRARIREPRLAAAADRRGEGKPAGLLPEVPDREPARSRRRVARAARPRPGVAGLPVSRGNRRRGAEKPLNGWEMASRMSFFLWSSIPDDELRRAAAAGELSHPTMLARQVKRMTADPKARRVATEFFGQWLGFYRFDEYRGVDTGRFPEFTDDVKAAMYDEAVSTFEYIVRQGPARSRRCSTPTTRSSIAPLAQVLRRRERRDASPTRWRRSTARAPSTAAARCVWGRC